MDKKKLLDQASGEERMLLARVLDRAEQAEQRNIPACSDFLSPAQRMAVEDLLREHPPEEDMTRLAQRITAAVRRSQTEHQDDITVAVLRLHRLEQE